MRSLKLSKLFIVSGIIWIPFSTLVFIYYLLPLTKKLPSGLANYTGIDFFYYGNTIVGYYVFLTFLFVIALLLLTLGILFIEKNTKEVLKFNFEYIEIKFSLFTKFLIFLVSLLFIFVGYMVLLKWKII